MLVGLILIMLLTPVITAQEIKREVIINIPAFTLYLYENGLMVRAYPIGVGNELKPSILGRTEVINRVENPTYYPVRWWERGLEPIPPGPDNPVGTRWIGLGFSGYGIHGTNNPDSVGKAMSSGCIRMYNHDVEELMDLIRVGTPVTIIYQTILVNQDPLLSTRSIIIHPDIYTNGSNTIGNIKKLLEQRNWTDVFYPAVEGFLQDPTGKAQPLPIIVDCLVNGEAMAAVKYGNNVYLPLASVANPQEVDQRFSDQIYWDQLYVNIVELAEKFGFGFDISSQMELFTVEFTLFGEKIGVNGFLQADELLVPLEQVSDALGIPLAQDIVEDATTINGINYLSQAESEKLGLRIEWQYPETEAKIELPVAYLDGQELGFVIYREDAYILFNSLFQLIDAKIELYNDSKMLILYDTHVVEIITVDDQIYVPEWLIRWLMPGAELVIK